MISLILFHLVLCLRSVYSLSYLFVLCCCYLKHMKMLSWWVPIVFFHNLCKLSFFFYMNTITTVIHGLDKFHLLCWDSLFKNIFKSDLCQGVINKANLKSFIQTEMLTPYGNLMKSILWIPISASQVFYYVFLLQWPF